MLVVFARGVLVYCWVWGDRSPRTNLALTALYVASWGLVFLPRPSSTAFAIAQALFAIVVGGMMFGVDWIMQDAHHWH
jgi:hypothetical protein